MSKDAYSIFLEKMAALQAARTAKEFYKVVNEVVLKDDGAELTAIVETIATNFLTSLNKITDRNIREALYRLFAVYDSTTVVTTLASDPLALASKEVQKEMEGTDDDWIKDALRRATKSNPPS